LTLPVDPSNSFSPDHLGRAEVFREGQIAIRAERYQLEGDYRPHDHRFLELALILGGEGIHHTLHGEHPLQTGSVVVLRPGAWHAYHTCKALEVFNAYVGEDVLHRELAWINQDPLLGRFLWTLPRSLDRAEVLWGTLEPERLQECQGCWETLERLSSASVEAERGELVGQLLLLLTRLAQGLPTQAKNTAQAPSLPAVVLDCIEQFERDPARPWTLELLVRSSGLHPSHLSRLFTRATGLPPLAYLNRWRLERAAVQLAQTEHPISQIGAEMGWMDANLFARRFREHFGSSPSTFRQRYR